MSLIERFHCMCCMWHSVSYSMYTNVYKSTLYSTVCTPMYTRVLYILQYVHQCIQEYSIFYSMYTNVYKSTLYSMYTNVYKSSLYSTVCTPMYIRVLCVQVHWYSIFYWCARPSTTAYPYWHKSLEMSWSLWRISWRWTRSGPPRTVSPWDVREVKC